MANTDCVKEQSAAPHLLQLIQYWDTHTHTHSTSSSLIATFMFFRTVSEECVCVCVCVCVHAHVCVCVCVCVGAGLCVISSFISQVVKLMNSFPLSELWLAAAVIVIWRASVGIKETSVFIKWLTAAKLNKLKRFVKDGHFFSLNCIIAHRTRTSITVLEIVLFSLKWLTHHLVAAVCHSQYLLKFSCPKQLELSSWYWW